MEYKNKKQFVIFIVVIFVLSSASLWICWGYPTKNREWKAIINYNVVVTSSNNSSSFNISVPMALDENDLPSEIVKNLKTTGESSWQIVTTEKGTALRIFGHGNATVYGTFSKNMIGDMDMDVLRDPKGFFHFDMWRDQTSWDIWFGSHNPQLNQTLQVTFAGSIDSIEYEQTIILTDEWQIAHLRVSQTVP